MSRGILEEDGRTVGIIFVSMCFNALAENLSLVTREMDLELHSQENKCKTPVDPTAFFAGHQQAHGLRSKLWCIGLSSHGIYFPITSTVRPPNRGNRSRQRTPPLLVPCRRHSGSADDRFQHCYPFRSRPEQHSSRSFVGGCRIRAALRHTPIAHRKVPKSQH